MNRTLWLSLPWLLGLALPLEAGRPEPAPEVRAARPLDRKATVLERIVLRLPPVWKTPQFRPETAKGPGTQASLVPGLETAFAPAPPPAGEAGAPASAPPLEDEAFRGQVKFDQGSGALGRLAAWFKGADRVPAWPGQLGDAVRLHGRRYDLDERIRSDARAAVYRSKRGGDFEVTLINPARSGDADLKKELLALERLRRSDIPHRRLVDRSADGLVLVQDRVLGEGIAELEARGQAKEAKNGLAELAARLIRAGLTADLRPSNLEWSRWGGRWILRSVKDVAAGRPWQVLGQLITGDLPKRAGYGAPDLLAAVRGRFGPESPVWRGVEEEAARAPPLKERLLELSRRDKALSPAPRLEFSAAADRDPLLDDSPAGWPEIKRRLGYDPLALRGQKLHLDDPGKTNTDVFLIRPAGRPAMILKFSNREVIKNELAMRRITRRFFGKYFRTPHSLGDLGGLNSGMVMEYSPGQPSYAHDPLNLEQRVAMALLALTFGLTNGERANILSEPRGPVLIDFEQAFSRMSPNYTALPVDSIIADKPWVSRFGRNYAEHYGPAVRAWRKFFLRPESQKAVEEILLAGGFSARETPPLLDTFRRNVSELEWSIQNDVELANTFADLPPPRREP